MRVVETEKKNRQLCSIRIKVTKSYQHIAHFSSVDTCFHLHDSVDQSHEEKRSVLGEPSRFAKNQQEIFALLCALKNTNAPLQICMYARCELMCESGLW